MSGYTLTRSAEQDIADIWDYIAKDNPDAADKLMACLNHAVRHSPEYKHHRGYFDACARWWVELTPEQRETGLVVVGAFTHRHHKGAEGIAASLPPAPKCPLMDQTA